MTRNILIIVVLFFFISGCSSVPNLNSGDGIERELDDVMRALIPNDPVPSEIKLKKGVYIVADVQHIRDGDTITVNNIDTSYLDDKSKANEIEKVIKENNGSLGVRFISIDTPEITNGKNEYYGEEAKKAVDKLLFNGKVILELDPAVTFDNYNRLLAHAYTIEGNSVQKHLLNNGLARVAYLYDDYKYTTDYRKAEERARNKKLNIHSIEGYVKWDEIAGFDMTVPVGEWTLPKEPPSPEEVVERMREINLSDFFNFGVSGPN